MAEKEKALRDCIKRIKQDSFKERLNELQSKIKVVQGLKEERKLDKLLLEYNELVREFSACRKI